MCSLAIAVAFVLLVAGGALAAQSDFSLRFASHRPGTATALRLHIIYRKPADPTGKPSPIRHLVTTAPPGTRFNLRIPRCTASDDEISAQGPGACPANSEVGHGTLTAMTGFGPPIDPYPTDVTIFNTGDGIVEVIQDHSGATLADDRIKIRGSTMIGNPPPVPGGPPDGQTAVREIDFTFPARTGFVTTPPTCRTGEWKSKARFTFADGTTQRVSSTTPCTGKLGRGRPRIHVTGVPRHCVRRGFKAHVRISARGVLKAVKVRVDGRLRLRTRRKRFSVRVHARAMASGRHTLSLVARDASGKRARKASHFRRCG